jgi:hypothetical protein
MKNYKADICIQVWRNIDHKIDMDDILNKDKESRNQIRQGRDQAGNMASSCFFQIESNIRQIISEDIYRDLGFIIEEYRP